jgi:hypothetical protein
VQVWPGGTTGGTNFADNLSFFNLLAEYDINLIQVSEQ